MTTADKQDKRNVSSILKQELQGILNDLDAIPEKEQNYLLQLLMGWKNPQRRGDEREGVSSPVDFTVNDQLYSGTVLDVSVGGVCVSCHQAFRTGQVVVLTFQLPGTDKPIKASGEIVWAKKDCFGVNFKTVSDYLYEYFGNVVVQF